MQSDHAIWSKIMAAVYIDKLPEMVWRLIRVFAILRTLKYRGVGIAAFEFVRAHQS